MSLIKRIPWLIPLLVLSGCTTLGNNPQDTEYTVIKEPAYQRGNYFNTGNGYYISNLTPEPVQAEGCDMPIMTADLSAARSEDEDIYITEIDVKCEGS